MYLVDTKKISLRLKFYDKSDALEYAKKNGIDYIIDTSKNCKIDVTSYNFIRYYSIYIKNNNDVINLYGSENIQDIVKYLKLRSEKSIYKYFINNIEDMENIASDYFIIKDYIVNI